MAFVTLPLAAVQLTRRIWAILQTPKTCENFIRLCKRQYYDGTIFHRCIRNFVVSDVGELCSSWPAQVLQGTPVIPVSSSSGARNTRGCAEGCPPRELRPWR